MRVCSNAKLWSVRASLLRAMTATAFGATACGTSMESESQSLSAPIGIAHYTFYSCETATDFAGERLTYTVPHFNNTYGAIDLTASVPASIRERNRAYGLPAGPSTTARLTKLTTNRWSDNERYTVTLAQKPNGAKTIEVVDHTIRTTARGANGSCQMACEGATAADHGRCIWTGETAPDPLGDFLIQHIVTAGTGVLFRSVSAGVTRILLARRMEEAAVGASSDIVTAASYDEALGNLDAAVRGTNPLSGLGLVGNGNCANEAITQAIRLVTGYWACATPYFLGPDANRWDDIVRDASLVLGSKKAGIGFKPTADIGDIERDLSSLEDGEIALLGSGTPKHGHATLVLKVKGKLIHINNQGWEPKVSTLAAWGEQWRAFAASQNEARVGFHVKLVFANALRF